MAPLSNTAERLSPIDAKNLPCNLLRPRPAKKRDCCGYIRRFDVFSHQTLRQGSVADRLRQAVGKRCAHPSWFDDVNENLQAGNLARNCLGQSDQTSLACRIRGCAELSTRTVDGADE